MVGHFQLQFLKQSILHFQNFEKCGSLGYICGAFFKNFWGYFLALFDPESGAFWFKTFNHSADKSQKKVKTQKKSKKVTYEKKNGKKQSSYMAEVYFQKFQEELIYIFKKCEKTRHLE